MVSPGIDAAMPFLLGTTALVLMLKGQKREIMYLMYLITVGSSYLEPCFDLNLTPASDITMRPAFIVLQPLMLLIGSRLAGSSRVRFGLLATYTVVTAVSLASISGPNPSIALQAVVLFGNCWAFLGIRPLLLGWLHVSIAVIGFIAGHLAELNAQDIWYLMAMAQCGLMLFAPFMFAQPEDPDKHNAEMREAKGEAAKARASNLNITRKFTKRALHEHYDAIFIGSGIGSLSTASMMSSAGKSVLLLEQHDRTGGCLHHFTEIGGGYFDSGVHYIGRMDYLKPLFRFITHPCLPIRWKWTGDVYDHIVFDEDDVKRPVRYTVSAFCDELCQLFPDDADKIRQYMYDVYHKASMVTWALMLQRIISPNSILYRWADAALGLDACIHRYTSKSCYDFICQYGFKSPKLRSILGGGQMVDHNESPKEGTWWVPAAMLYYYKYGAYYPVGGSHAITRSFVAKIRTGNPKSDILTQIRVKSIIVENGAARGVILDDDNYTRVFADIVVSNAGLHNTFTNLMSDIPKEEIDAVPKLKHVKEIVEKFPLNRPQMNGFIVLNRPPQEFGLKAHNIHSLPGCGKYGYDIDRVQKRLYEDPTNAAALDDSLMFISCPCVKDPNFTSEYPGVSNIAILTVADEKWFGTENPRIIAGPKGCRTAEYQGFKEAWAEAFVRRVKLHYPLIKDEHIVRVEVGTPVTAEGYLGAPGGATYGLKWSPERFDHSIADVCRPETVVKNLYISGEGAFFGGILGATAGGLLCANRILGMPTFIWTMLKEFW